MQTYLYRPIFRREEKQQFFDPTSKSPFTRIRFSSWILIITIYVKKNLFTKRYLWSTEIRLTDEQDGKCKNFFVVMVIELKYWNFEKLFSPISFFYFSTKNWQGETKKEVYKIEEYFFRIFIHSKLQFIAVCALVLWAQLLLCIWVYRHLNCIFLFLVGV